MANINTELFDAATRHQIYLERYGTSISNEALKILKRSEKDAREIFDERIAKILTLGYDSGPATTQRTNNLISELSREIEAIRVAQSIDPLAEYLLSEWESFSDYETEFQLNTLNSAAKDALSDTPFAISFAPVSTDLVYAAALAKPFSVKPGASAETMEGWLAGIPESERKRIEQTIKSGVLNGETTREITRRVFGTIQEQKNDKGNSAIIITRRGTEGLVRTSINHISTVAKDELYKANDDIIDGVEWVSTLDSKTTPVCQVRDGKVYPVNSGPRPPAHVNCRSTITPILKSYRELGIDVDDPERSTRAYFAIPEKMNVTEYRAKLKKDGITKVQQDKIIRNLSGQTDAKDFDSFLSRQNKEFQETVLGIERTKLYRNKGLTLSQLISPKEVYYTLDELREIHPSLF